MKAETILVNRYIKTFAQKTPRNKVGEELKNKAFDYLHIFIRGKFFGLKILSMKTRRINLNRLRSSP